MNGPISMYRLKPVVHFPDPIALSPTMYRMKNIYSSVTSSPAGDYQDASILPNILEQVNKLLKKPSLEIEDLKKRQEAILKQLTYLKEQMLALREELNKKNPTIPVQIDKQTETKNNSQKLTMEPSWTGVIGEIVIHASPDSPPYSLLAVNQLWPNHLRVRVTCHTHSSVPTLHPQLAIFSILELTPNPTLNVRLIWKQMGPDCEMIVSPLTHCPIRGEVNLLRYLYRTIIRDDLDVETQQDSTLDLCHRLSHAHTLRDKQLLVRALNARLAKFSWFGGGTMSVVDLAACSVIRSMSGVELSQNMTRWQTRCSAAFGVEAV